ncbi:Protein kinase [Coemansia sp. RSA 1813]|nr:Protein kinase [Coemansia sp. RSA 1646]KAJ1771060.1 Protein kinase [Coemansia sp. RSA 1843]KAJ2089805.1 Protein kinase [Coemansia sp. RSA 986]KAJ2214810.1 Protein kinase [Coemansia sp. RSA 487]KAJ2569799.1 Protein kinase [Coemansia sp. RSA 1813]
MSGKQKIGSYTVLQTVGVGSFGKVKLAVHSQTGHKVALKIIGRSKLAHSDMIGRVNREIQYLKMLRHPHIIKLYEVITTSTDIIMVIEYAGGELFNYIVERGRMNERDARRFFQQIVSAVEYCHRRNIVHRDLKPENVLLDPYDNVKVADFGLSNIMKDGEFLQTSCGSPNYAAPEVINGKLYAGPEVDAWSCGVILYVMMCGRLPFDDDHIPALFKKITAGVFTMPGYLSQGARAVLSGLLQVDPLKRMTLAQVRQHSWFTTDLPEYLKPLPESTDIECLVSLDESIISELERQLDMDHRSLVLQLRQRGTNPAKVAYQLTLDNRHMLEQSRNSNKQGIRNFALASSPPAAFHMGSMHEARDRISGTPGGTATLPLMSGRPGAEGNGTDNDDDEHEKSSIAILGSSLPRSPGHTLETQMYKMRLRGPNANLAGIDGAAAAPRVSSPLAAPPGQQTQTGQKSIPMPVNPDISKLGSSAISGNSASSSPSHTPSNYFRASLPPLVGTPKSANDSASSSIASLAHASLKATSTSTNPYSHRNDSGSGSGEELPAQNSQRNSNPATGAAAALSSPLANAVEANDNSEDVQMQDASADAAADNNASDVQRKPTVMRKRAKLTRTRWHFGIRSRSPPADVMAEVYRALRQLRMTWKHFNPYHLRAKYVIPTGSELAQLAGEKEIKIDLQLYKLDSRDNYLVDFKAVIPQPRAGDELGDASRSSTYRAGENTLISPLPPFIQAARRRFSAAGAMRSGMAGSHNMYPSSGDGSHMAVDSDGAEPRSLDDQFLDSDYPIQLPAELPVTVSSPVNAANDRSDALPKPDALPAKTVQRKLGGEDEDDSSPLSHTLDGRHQTYGGGSSDSMSIASGTSGHKLHLPQQQQQQPMPSAGIPIPGSMSLQPTRAMDIPSSSNHMSGARNGAVGASSFGRGGLGGSLGSSHMVGGTPRSQGRAPGSYMPGSVVGRVSLARTDVSLTADGVGAGSGANRQSQERVVNIFPFFDVCCKLITELAVPSTSVDQAAASKPKA